MSVEQKPNASVELSYLEVVNAPAVISFVLAAVSFSIAIYKSKASLKKLKDTLAQLRKNTDGKTQALKNEYERIVPAGS